MKQQWVFASGNAGKLREVSAITREWPVDLLPQSQWQVSEAVEDGLSFIENALIKARHASAATGLPAIADDSGLSVESLQGQPGIYSARFAGEAATDTQNLQKLLDLMQDTPATDRVAAFYCAMVFVRHAKDPTPIIATGQWQGTITKTASGAGGFGYDPIFWLNEQKCTSAELSKDIKNQLSHRAQALKILKPLLERQFFSN